MDRDRSHVVDRAQTISSLSVLVPVYNSEQSIGRLVDAVVEELANRFERLEMVLVNDGSPDQSHARILEAMERHPGLIRYVRLAKNFGEHNAVMCGLNYATGDCVAIIDDDFQNPPSEIMRLVDKLREGYDVVYSYYDTKRHHWFRNVGSRFNNWVATGLLKKPKGLYLSSFKVMNRFLVDVVTDYDGPYPYLDGLILRSTNAIGTQLCEHAPRGEGASNYNFRRLVRLWLNMLTSFSVTPLRISTVLGFLMSGFGLLLSVIFFVSYFIERESIPPGWASIIVSITVFAGIQLCMLGMVGEYLGRVFLTQNRQPQFIVRETAGIEPDEGKEVE